MGKWAWLESVSSHRNDEDARPLTPEERLCEAILWRALRDVTGGEGNDYLAKPARLDALKWFEEGSNEPGGFGWVSGYLGLSTDFVDRCRKAEGVTAPPGTRQGPSVGPY